MRARRIAGFVLGILTVPVLILGILDPVEGGLALLVGGAMLLLTYLVSRVPVPRSLWIPWLSAVVLGIVALVAVAQYYPWRAYPWWIWALVIGYEVAAGITAAGGVIYAMRLGRRIRADRQEPSVTELAHEDAQQRG